MFCKNCGNEIHEGESYCGNCGAKIVKDAYGAHDKEKVCLDCGETLADDDLFCRICGHRVGAESEKDSSDNNVYGHVEEESYNTEVCADAASDYGDEGRDNEPAENLKIKVFWKFVLLGLVTFGIYDIYVMWHTTKDLNEICRDDGKPSCNYILVMILSAVTFGIYWLYWWYNQGKRLFEISPIYNVDIKENGITYLIWILFLNSIGGIVAIYLLFKNLNKCIIAYNNGVKLDVAHLQQKATTRQKILIGVSAAVIAAYLTVLISLAVYAENSLTAVEPVKSEDVNIETQDHKKTITDEYILPDSNSKYLTDEDLTGLNKWKCILARNEIYARHGRMFNDTRIQEYFKKQSWYEPAIPAASFKESMLNEYEKYNVKHIVEYEVAQGYRDDPEDKVQEVADVNVLLTDDSLINKRVTLKCEIGGTNDQCWIWTPSDSVYVNLYNTDNYDIDYIVDCGGDCEVTGLFYYDEYGDPSIDVENLSLSAGYYE